MQRSPDGKLLCVKFHNVEEKKPEQQTKFVIYSITTGEGKDCFKIIKTLPTKSFERDLGEGKQMIDYYSNLVGFAKDSRAIITTDTLRSFVKIMPLTRPTPKYKPTKEKFFQTQESKLLLQTLIEFSTGQNAHNNVLINAINDCENFTLVANSLVSGDHDTAKVIEKLKEISKSESMASTPNNNLITKIDNLIEEIKTEEKDLEELNTIL